MVTPVPPSPETGKTVPEAEAEHLRLRLDALKAELGEVTAPEAVAGKASGSGNESAMGVGLRAGSELSAGVLVGCGVGYVLDRQFDTSPIGLIIFLMIGFAAGFWNIYRMGVSTTPPGKGR
jgi:ATP synthase protein I